LIAVPFEHAVGSVWLVREANFNDPHQPYASDGTFEGKRNQQYSGFHLRWHYTEGHGNGKGHYTDNLYHFRGLFRTANGGENHCTKQVNGIGNDSAMFFSVKQLVFRYIHRPRRGDPMERRVSKLLILIRRSPFTLNYGLVILVIGDHDWILFITLLQKPHPSQFL
jgi:hypothetical protein